MEIAIVGAGASGLFLAQILSRRSDYKITIFERNKKIGSKLKASGNGKCNFANYKAMPTDYNNKEFISSLFEKVKKEDLLNYLNDLGFLFKFDDEGRMYPITDSSESFLNLLTSDFKNVDIKLETIVNSIEKKNNKYLVNGIPFDKVVLATGSNASIKKEYWASTYSYLDNLNLKMNKCRPSLVGYILKNNVKLLSGFRSKADVKLYSNSKLVFSEFGEVIFKDDGISGIVIMNSSHYYDESDSYLVLNLFPNVDRKKFELAINKRLKTSNDLEYVLTGLVHPTLIKYLKNQKLNIDKIVDYLYEMKLSIKSTYSLEYAQVSKGGVDVSELNPNFSLKKDPNIYLMGEMIDINGVCGGFNLMYAFMSAMVVGKDLTK